jgi:uncharacterized protein YuzE
VTHDLEADAVYVYFREPGTLSARTEEVDEDRYVDYDESGALIGIELLGVSHGVQLDGLPRAEEIAAQLVRLGITVIPSEKIPGPQADGSFYDPYDELSDEEFDRQTDELFAARRQPAGGEAPPDPG